MRTSRLDEIPSMRWAERVQQRWLGEAAVMWIQSPSLYRQQVQLEAGPQRLAPLPVASQQVPSLQQPQQVRRHFRLRRRKAPRKMDRQHPASPVGVRQVRAALLRVWVGPCRAEGMAWEEEGVADLVSWNFGSATGVKA